MLQLYNKYDCNVTDFKCKRLCTILHEAIHFLEEKVLLHYVSMYKNDIGTALLETDLEGYTGLHVAAQYQNSDLLTSFINRIPKESICSALREPELDGWTVLHYAAKHQNLQFIKYAISLLNKEAANAFIQPDNFQCTPFHLCCKYQSEECVEYLMEIIETTKNEKIYKSKRSDKNTPLHLAARFQTTKILQRMLSTIPNDEELVNILSDTNKDKKTILHLVARSKNSESLQLIFDKLGSKAKNIVLIEDKHQMTVLHLIVKNYGRTMLKRILKTFRDSGDHLLHLALTSKTCSKSIVSIILRLYGSNAKEEILCTVEGNSGLHLAVSNQSQTVIGLLLSAIGKDKEIIVAWMTKNINGKNCSQLVKKNRLLKGNKSWEVYFSLRFDPASCTKLKTNERYNLFDFNNLPFSRTLIESFVNFAHSYREIKKINFKRCNITDGSLQILIPWLSNQKLESVNFADNNISIYPPLFDLFDKSLTTLRYFSLQNNWITTTEQQFLKLTSQRLLESNLKEIDISGNFLSNDNDKNPKLELKQQKPIHQSNDNNTKNLPSMVHHTYKKWFFISFEETVASVLSPLHGTDTKHWHVMLCCKKTERAKIFLEGMNSNGQRFLRCIRIPHFSKVTGNLKAVNRCLPIATLNLSKYKGKSWPISREQGLQLLDNVAQNISLDADSTGNILQWGISMLNKINVNVDINSFVEEAGIKNAKNCCLM